MRTPTHILFFTFLREHLFVVPPVDFENTKVTHDGIFHRGPKPKATHTRRRSGGFGHPENLGIPSELKILKVETEAGWGRNGTLLIWELLRHWEKLAVLSSRSIRQRKQERWWSAPAHPAFYWNRKAAQMLTSVHTPAACLQIHALRTSREEGNIYYSFFTIIFLFSWRNSHVFL